MINLNSYITEKFKLNKNHTYKQTPEYDDIVLIISCSDKDKTCDLMPAKVTRVTQVTMNENDDRLLFTIEYTVNYQNNIYPKKFITDTEDASYDARQYKDGSRIFTSKQFFLLYKDNAINLIKEFLERNKSNNDKKLYKGYSVIWGKMTQELGNDMINYLNEN